jgi:ATP-dependent Clp protease ATP-binding subunit ClpB
VLKALLDDEDHLAANSPKRPAAMRRWSIRRRPAQSTKQAAAAGTVYLAPETARLFDQAEQLSQKAGDAFFTVEYMLLALALASGTAAEILKQAGITAQNLNKAISDLRKGRTADTASAEQGYEALKKYTRDFTEEARHNKLDPVIGRDNQAPSGTSRGQEQSGPDRRGGRRQNRDRRGACPTYRQGRRS